MSIYNHGLVIGKFYPPHAGHHFLIRTAAANCRQVTVVVEYSQYQRIPLADRLAWLEAEHQSEPQVRFIGTRNDIPMNLTDRATWDAEVTVVRRAARQMRAPKVDAVFSSEFYGDRLATYFDAPHIMVDQPRERIPMSGTKFRHSPVTWWHNLSPHTRAGLTTRICVVGSESTGTTTVAKRLTDMFRQRSGFERTQCIPEYGRDYAEKKIAEVGGVEGVTWTNHDFRYIAARQTVSERQGAGSGSPILICDTDALATEVWAYRYLGSDRDIDPSWARAPECPPKAVYLVTDHDGVPFEQDGTRDGEHIRAEMTRWFLDTLDQHGASWVLLTGPLDDRVRFAFDVSDALLHQRLRGLE